MGKLPHRAPKVNLGINLVATYRGMGYTIVSMGRLLGLAYQDASDIFSGQYVPNKREREAVSKLLGIPVDTIWPDRSEYPPEGGGERVMRIRRLRPEAGPTPDATTHWDVLRAKANVQVGDRYLRHVVRVTRGVEDIEHYICTVEQVYPYFFLVKREKTGIHECFTYRDVLTNAIRRIK